jgi:putative mRNA 3-end processing factor
MNQWWLTNASRGITSVIYAYSLGKAQRVLLGVDAGNGPLAAHGSVLAMNAAYSAAGIALPACMAINKETLGEIKGRGLVIAPPSAGGNNAWLRKLTGPGGVEEAMASGWMRVRGKRRWRSVATGFVLSDHADWPGLLWAIRATGATRVGVTHGSSGALARWLREHGTGAFVVPTRFKGDEDAQEEAT